MRGFGTTFAVTIFLAIVTFATNLVYARLLGPEGRGELTSIVAFASTIAAIAQFGLAQSSVYYARRGQLPAGFVTAAAFLVAAASVGITLAVWQVVEVTIGLGLFTLFCFSASIQSFVLAIAQGRRNLDGFNLARVIAPTAAIVLFGIAWWVGWQSVNSAVASVIAGGILALGPIFRRPRSGDAPHSVASSDERNPASGMVIQAAGFYAITLLGVITSYADKIFLTYVSASAVVGVYAVAYGLSRLLAAVWQSASFALYAHFAGSDIGSALDEVIGSVFRLAFLPMLVAAALAVAIGIYAIPLLFGDDFEGAIPLFAILAFEAVIGGISWFIAQKFTASGRPHLAFYRQGVSLALFVACLPFVSADRAAFDLAWILLGCAVLRLVMSLWLFWRETGKVLSILPNSADLTLLLGTFQSALKRVR